MIKPLPLADPFEEMEGDVVNTDDLLEVFESYDDAPGQLHLEWHSHSYPHTQ